MVGKRTITVGDDLEVNLWSILEFVGLMGLAALATGMLATSL